MEWGYREISPARRPITGKGTDAVTPTRTSWITAATTKTSAKVPAPRHKTLTGSHRYGDPERHSLGPQNVSHSVLRERTRQAERQSMP